jgi:hypothetical protein
MPARARILLAAAFAVAAMALAPQAASADSGPCTVETGRRLVQPTDPNTNGIGVTNVFCGSFLGPGSQAMLVAFNPQCGCTTDIYTGWEVFGLTGGAWQPSTDGAHDIGLVNLTVSGATLTEEREIRRSTDMFPWARTGGRQTRAWNWDGAFGLQAGEWVQTIPAQPEDVVALVPRQTQYRARVTFRPAGQPIVCQVGDDRTVFARCEFRGSRIATARMNAGGSVRTCRARAHRSCRLKNPALKYLPLLHTGKSVVVGRYRCRATRPGAECLVSSTGKGFAISRSSDRRVGS